jgi:hypothetical protein
MAGKWQAKTTLLPVKGIFQLPAKEYSDHVPVIATFDTTL